MLLYALQNEEWQTGKKILSTDNCIGFNYLEQQLPRCSFAHGTRAVTRNESDQQVEERVIQHPTKRRMGKSSQPNPQPFCKF